MKDKLPIVIAGAGPSGSTLALYLAKHDIPVLILEKESHPPRDLRASTFHPISLDLLADLDADIVDTMLQKGLQVQRYQYRDRRTGETATFDMSLISDETGHPFRLQLEQYELTQLNCQSLKAFPHVDLRFDYEVRGYSETEGGVEVFTTGPDGNQTFEGAFVVGAEGARSAIRKSAGLGFLGFTYDEKFLVVSTPFPFEEVFDDFSYVNYVADPDEWCVVLRTDKLWRVLFPTTPENENDEALLLSDAFIQERMHHLYDKDG
ncbi:MAG: FAD-dependent oxidoreductase, partial [Woeseiaceae bacterium]